MIAEQCPSCGAVVGGWFERVVRAVLGGKPPVIHEVSGQGEWFRTDDTKCRRCHYVLDRYTTFGPFEFELPSPSLKNPT